MQFKRIFIKNFMSVGDDPIELFFDDYKGPTLIQGSNLDVSETASNGAGKSLVFEAMAYGLFDKTIRGLKKDECINNTNQKHLHIEIEVDNLKIVRKRKPTNLYLEIDGKPKNLSTADLTQKLIEEELGINYETFISISFFGQHNMFNFLSAKKEVKRAIVENLLHLEEYNAYEKNARDHLREIKKAIIEFDSEYSSLRRSLDNKKHEALGSMNALKQYKEKLRSEIQYIESQIQVIDQINIQKEEKNWKDYEESQIKITEFKQKQSDTQVRISQMKVKLAPIEQEWRRNNDTIKKIKSLTPGVRCTSCFQDIDPKNYQCLLKDLEDTNQEISHKAATLSSKDSGLQKELGGHITYIKLLQKVKRPAISYEKLMTSRANKDNLVKLLAEKNEQLQQNPYKETLARDEKVITELKEQIDIIEPQLKTKENDKKYYEFWIKGFGDVGIKSYIIQQLIPVLNEKINYWLQFLIDNKIQVFFDEYLDVEIKRVDTDGLTYKQGSGGEKKRIDLAISLAFADIMRLSTKTDNNIMFLDEVAESLDGDGVEGVYKTILELSNERSIFIITHHTQLLEKLENIKRLNIVKENNFTKLSL